MKNVNKILVVDDEPAIAQLLVVLLGTHGYKVEVVATGQEAMARVNGDTELILLDAVLPDYDGFEICHLLKTSSRTRHIPIIMLGEGEHNNRIESFYLGADDYLAKPFQPEELFVHIDTALQHNRIAVHDEQLKPSYEVIRELRQIIDQKSVSAYFQPIYLLNPLRLFGMEVLSRPQTRGVLSNPEDLFKVALRYGLYYELEMIVWRKAIEIARRNFDHEHLFLNCSPCLIEQNHFDAVRVMFEELHMTAHHVFLELTERSAITEHQMFFKHLESYREHGFKIAIDDVGAGYASLEAIIKTRPEVVKIDRQIVTGLGKDSFKRSIVKLIIAFCKENSIICIAEGIETKEDYRLLVDLGVQAGQGYYLYRPTGQIDLKAMTSITV